MGHSKNAFCTCDGICGVGLTILSLNRRGIWLNQVKIRVAEDDVNEIVATATASPKQKWLTTSNKFLKDLWFSGKFLLLAVVLGALLNTLVPAKIITQILGGNHWYSIPLADLAGIFTYGISGAPIVKVLMGMGMSKGAGMAFLIAGHATSIGLMTTLFTLVRRPLFVFYVAATLIISLVFGYGFQLI